MEDTENKIISEEQVTELVRKMVRAEIAPVWDHAHELGSKQGSALGYVEALNDAMDALTNNPDSFKDWVQNKIAEKKAELNAATDDAVEIAKKQWQNETVVDNE